MTNSLPPTKGILTHGEDCISKYWKSSQIFVSQTLKLTNFYTKVILFLVFKEIEINLKNQYSNYKKKCLIGYNSKNKIYMNKIKKHV